MESAAAIMECRLCLEALTEPKWSIEQPELREQLNQVFRFTVNPQSGFSSDICIVCLTMIEEFYMYSERVRCNQAKLIARLKDLPVHSIKSETLDEELEAKEECIEEFGGNDECNDDNVDNADYTCIDEVFVQSLTVEVKKEPQAKRRTRSLQKLTESNDKGETNKEKRQKRTSVRKSTNELKVEKEEAKGEIKATKEEIPEQSSTDEGNSTENDGEYQPERKKQRTRRKKSDDSTVTKKQQKGETSSKEQRKQDDIRIQEFYEMVCDICGDKTKDMFSLRKHFRANHDMAAYIKCCNKKLMRRGTMVDHILIHVDPKMYRCEPCDKTFKGKRYLQEHMENVHGSIEERPFKCEKCDRYFAKESFLKTHISNHRKVHCSQCNQEFPNSRFLNEHLKTVHDNAHLTRVCDRCGKSFSGPSARSGLKQHIEGVHLKLGDKTKHQCPLCQKWLLGKRCLTVHMQLHSEVGLPHICNICNQNYPHSRALTRHKRFVHGEQKYECEFCGKKFRKSVALKEHRATHTGEALYTCKICGSTTNSNASYYSHMKKQHPVEWAEQKLKAEEATRPATAEPAVTLSV
ncbi:hypothetical protein RP20_CCG011608 [Aedes albopictus]|nr:hypothetical protein RP20_CCG011608 [Aedes albopictus]